VRLGATRDGHLAFEPRAHDRRCTARSGVTAVEHGGRAPRPRDPTSRPRECTRQDRGEVRSPRRCRPAIARRATRRSLPRRPRRPANITTTAACAHATRAAASAAGAVRTSRPPRRALTRHGQRRLLRRADGRRDTHLDLCCVTCANHEVRTSGLSPRSCRTLRANLCPDHNEATRASTKLDGSSAAIAIRVHHREVGRGLVPRRSFVTHPDELPANAPGRSE
jgi:hypothetical protein